MSDQSIRPQIEEGLVGYSDLRGRPSSTVRNEIIPTLPLEDLSRTPYMPTFGHGVMITVTANAVVGQNGVIVIRPRTGWILDVTAIDVIFPVAGARNIELGWHADATLAAFGTPPVFGTVGKTRQGLNVGAELGGAESGAGARAGVLHALFQRRLTVNNALAGTTIPMNFRERFIAFARNEIRNLCIWNQTANDLFQVNIEGRCWPDSQG